MEKFATRGLLALAIVLGSISSAHAEVDLTALTGAAADIAKVGAAAFALAVGIKVFKWIRSAL